MTESSAQVFSDNWGIYKKIMQCNYMHHAEFSDHTAAIFKEMKQQQLLVLDIGCGDAIPVLPHLLSYGKINYTGYDLSGPALQIAAANLSSLSGNITLKEGDMLTLLQEERNMFDLIISSFAIHHLQDGEKNKLLENCYTHLKPGGKMIYTDIFLTQQPNREFYINEYFDNINSKWTLMSEKEKQPIFDHVRQFDFPSQLEDTINFCKKSGFIVTVIFQPDPWHTMILLSKNIKGDNNDIPAG
ncbi:MAG: class I SAM-dependent methyltransferase [Bacteroidota bacterium]